MFAKELHQAGHIKKFSITERGGAGWEVRDTQDDQVLKQICYTDWHRVERALHVFTIEIDNLERQGWQA